MDPFKYREVKALLTARVPDSDDAGANPDRVLLNGYGTAHPKFRGGSVVINDEFAVPRDIPVRVVDGHLMTEVFSDDESVLQPLFLPVTVDERANQNWSYQLSFDTLTIGSLGETISHPPLNFPVEDGEGPLELSTVATPVAQTGAFITRGLRGPGITDITAAAGIVTVEWDGGDDVTIPIPAATLATPSNDGLMSRQDKAEHDHLMGAGLVQTESIEPDEVQLRFDDSPDPILRISPDRGIVGTPIVHEPDTVDVLALTQDVRDRVLSVEEIPDWVGWDFAFRTQDGHVVFGRRSDGTWVGTEDMAAGLATPTAYVAYGDSTTNGVGVDGVTAGWVEVLRDEYNVPITNAGLSGARAEEITARLGGLFPTVTVSGGVIPASGGVSLEGFDIDMVRTGGIADLTIDLITENNQTVRGRLYRTGTVERQFSRLTPGEAVPAPGRVEVSSVTGREHSQARILLAQGVNNERMILDGDQTVDDLIAWYSSAAAAARHPIVVWGMLDRGPSEAVGTPRGDIIAEVEAWLRQRFGADFWPVRRYLASPQAIADAQLIDPAFTPTPQDVMAQEAVTVPPSFRTGTSSVHLNEFGHRIQARFMYRQIIKRGWL